MDIMVTNNQNQLTTGFESSGTGTAEDNFNTHSIYYYNGKETKYVAVKQNDSIVFAGTSSERFINDFFSGVIPKQMFNLAVTAINNRTKERNLARLSEQLALGAISDEDYERELSLNEEKYVIKCDVNPSIFELKMALEISTAVLDVNDTDDLSVLFSFDESKLQSSITER